MFMPQVRQSEMKMMKIIVLIAVMLSGGDGRCRDLSDALVNFFSSCNRFCNYRRSASENKILCENFYD